MDKKSWKRPRCRLHSVVDFIALILAQAMPEHVLAWNSPGLGPIQVLHSCAPALAQVRACAIYCMGVPGRLVMRILRCLGMN